MNARPEPPSDREISPTFTALVPAYNAGATVGAAIESILAQSRGDFEAIVIDDGSSDDTEEVARRYTRDRRVHVLSEPNRGPSAARNAGIEVARGTYVSLLDSDDLWLPPYLERMGSALDANPDAGFAYTDAWWLDARHRRIRRATAMAAQKPPAMPPTEAEEFLRELVGRNFVFVGATIRREALDEVGPFNESLSGAEDYELWLRMLARGYRALRVPGPPLAIKRTDSGALSQDRLRMFTVLSQVWRLVVEDHPAPEDVKAKARARMLWADRMAEELRDPSPGRRVARLVRRRLGAARRRFWWRTWQPAPPEVVRAFPDLCRR
jgi:glycosyltransferase involved in cell wall biosynthesis